MWSATFYIQQIAYLISNGQVRNLCKANCERYQLGTCWFALQFCLKLLHDSAKSLSQTLYLSGQQGITHFSFHVALCCKKYQHSLDYTGLWKTRPTDAAFKKKRKLTKVWMAWMDGGMDACKRPQSQNKNNRNPSEIQTARCSHSWAWLRSAPQERWGGEAIFHAM